MRCLAAFAVAACLLGTWSGPALAAGDCPDGDWFCYSAPDPAPPATPAPAPPRDRPPPLPPLPPDWLPPPPPGYDDQAGPQNDEPPAEPGFHEWGANLHAVIGLMGGDSANSPNAGMNGLGGTLRFRPIPYVAIEGAVELAWGTDYNGFQRFEDALLANGLFFANPKSAVQLYGIAGLGVGNASLDAEHVPSGHRALRDDDYWYFSTQLGVGVEARITRHFALGADIIGFLRWRIDGDASQNPEFVDPLTGHTTNESSGSLLRLGATFYW